MAKLDKQSAKHKPQLHAVGLLINRIYDRMSTSPSPYGEAWLSTFSFWLFVDMSAQPEVTEAQIRDTNVRFYAPFRSGAANYIPTPFVDAHAVPFLPGAGIHIAPDFKMLNIATVPQLPLEEGGQASMMLIWGDDWQERPPIFPMDSLRIDVQRSALELPSEVTHVVPRLLEQIRWRTRQWWIARSIAGLLGYVRNKFPITEAGTPLGLPEGAASGRAIHGFERPLNGTIWSESIHALQSGSLPPQYDLVLLDAYYNLSINDLRRAVLDASISVEQARDNILERVWQARSAVRFRRSHLLRGDDLTSHLSTDLDRFIGRSLHREDPETFGIIRDLWRTRNSIAHGGPPVYRRDDTMCTVDHATGVSLVRSAETCIRWLESL